MDTIHHPIDYRFSKIYQEVSVRISKNCIEKCYFEEFKQRGRKNPIFSYELKKTH
jgi:hypothetical protein